MRPGVDFTGVSTPFYCHDGAGRFLFQLRSQRCRNYHGYWDSGAGALEFGEDPEAGVLREVQEEYGCGGEITERLLPYAARWDEPDGARSHWLAVPFFVLVNPAAVRIGDREAMEDIGWFRLEALPEPLHPGVTLALARYPAAFARHAAGRGGER
jgi:8-oxo-dGTP pyrophosphatase MutT (NUDIX family)